MTVRGLTPAAATLGPPGHRLLALETRPAPGPSLAPRWGCVTSRPFSQRPLSLSRWVNHAARLSLRLGHSDPLVSEAVYLQDSDGHGTDVYHIRPSDTWPWQDGRVPMAADPIDGANLLAKPGADEPFTGLPAGTTFRYVHLRITNLAAAKAFSRSVPGLDVAHWPGTLFVSRNGDHHAGPDTWRRLPKMRASCSASA